MDVRAMRADAISSVTRILDAARRLLGAGEGGTLDAIAREAGVGVATLYRHFPNRQTLARAVYERVLGAELEPVLARLAGGGRDLLLEVADRIATTARRERGLVASVEAVGEATAELLARHRAAFDELVERGRAAGTLRADVSGADVPRLLAMLGSGAAALDVDEATRRRYLGLALDALGPRAA